MKDEEIESQVTLFRLRTRGYNIPQQETVEFARSLVSEARARALEDAVKEITTGDYCQRADHMQHICHCEEIAEAVRALKG